MHTKNCFFFGTIFKLHGYKGCVKLYIEKKVSVEITSIKHLFIDIENELIPHFIENVKLQNSTIALIKFRNVDTEEAAKKILKKEVYASNDIKKDSSDTCADENLIGYSVIDKTKGDIGLVSHVDNQTSQKLIVIKNKEKTIFIPFHENFIINIKNGYIEVDLPEDLLNIN